MQQHEAEKPGGNERHDSGPNADDPRQSEQDCKYRYADQQVTQNIEQLCEQITERFEPWVDGATPTIVDNAIHMEKPDGPAFVAELAAAFPDQLARITVGQPTLEDVFLHLTGHALWDGANPPV